MDPYATAICDAAFMHFSTCILHTPTCYMQFSNSHTSDVQMMESKNIFSNKVKSDFSWYINEPHNRRYIDPKKSTLKSNSFDVRQTVFYADTCKFGLDL